MKTCERKIKHSNSWSKWNSVCGKLATEYDEVNNRNLCAKCYKKFIDNLKINEQRVTSCN